MAPPSRTRSKTNAVRAANDVTAQSRILQVAIEQFAEKGFAAVRIDEVATAAGANKQLIYYYFRSKAELYDAALEHMVQETTKMWDSLDSAPSLEAALWRLGEWDEFNAHWRRLLAWEGLEYAKRDGAITMEESRTASWSRWVAIVRRAQEREEIAADLDVEMFALCLIALSGVAESLPHVVKMVTGAEPGSVEFRDRHTAFSRMLLQALARPS
jgi:TetR/AcrR family transcriptional regulator